MKLRECRTFCLGHLPGGALLSHLFVSTPMRGSKTFDFCYSVRPHDCLQKQEEQNKKTLDAEYGSVWGSASSSLHNSRLQGVTRE